MFIAPKEPEKPPEPEAPQDPKDCKIVAGRDTTIEFQKDKDKGIGFIIAGGSDTPLVNFIFFLFFFFLIKILIFQLIFWFSIGTIESYVVTINFYSLNWNCINLVYSNFNLLTI